MQETNPSTTNIARINMFLHGVRSFQQAPPSDSLRTPYFREGQTRRLRQFDRVVMNPPFSLDSWGYDDFVGGDPYDRFGFGLPPRDNGDYAWMQQVVKSLKPTGRAIVVMSQGILFRGGPAQTEAEDGRNQRADPEYVIREAFVKADLIECIVVLPSKLFYGNSVPACLVILNKRKAPERKGKILLIWASRYFEAANPQNLLRRADCLRVLVPWRAFGDLEACRVSILRLEGEFADDVAADRAARLAGIDTSYGPHLEPLPALRLEQQELEAQVATVPPSDREERRQHRELKKSREERLKTVKRQVRALERLESEVDSLRSEVRDTATRELALIQEATDDLRRSCGDPVAARRLFALVDANELISNEFNLNVPRYVDTAEPEDAVELSQAVAEFFQSMARFDACEQTLTAALRGNE
jgi:type I restriction enzyme M protein